MKDIKKVFIDEVEALLSPIAKKATLKIELAEGLKLDKFYGYAPRITRNTIELDLDNINSGLTQVILLKVKLDPATIQKKNNVKVNLSFYDVRRQKQASIVESSSLDYQENGLLIPDILYDAEVKKNFTIAEMAQAIKDFAVAMQNQQANEARGIVQACLGTVRQRYGNSLDQDMRRIHTILSNYENMGMARD